MTDQTVYFGRTVEQFELLAGKVLECSELMGLFCRNLKTVLRAQQTMKSWLAKFQSEVFKISQRLYQGHSSDIKKKKL